MHKVPLFPITVVFEESKEEWVLDDEQDAACNLEWFDSEDVNERVTVMDSLGRPVRLKVERLDVVLCELKV